MGWLLQCCCCRLLLQVTPVGCCCRLRHPLVSVRRAAHVGLYAGVEDGGKEGQRHREELEEREGGEALGGSDDLPQELRLDEERGQARHGGRGEPQGGRDRVEHLGERRAEARVSGSEQRHGSVARAKGYGEGSWLGFQMGSPRLELEEGGDLLASQRSDPIFESLEVRHGRG